MSIRARAPVSANAHKSVSVLCDVVHSKRFPVYNKPLDRLSRFAVQTIWGMKGINVAAALLSFPSILSCLLFFTPALAVAIAREQNAVSHRLENSVKRRAPQFPTRWGSINCTQRNLTRRRRRRRRRAALLLWQRLDADFSILHFN